MKKTYFLVLTILFINSSYGQWTNQSGTGNYYLNSGFVGIGTLPNSTLDINGNFQISNANIPMGLITESGGYNPLLNLDMNFRESNKNNSSLGLSFRLDGRTWFPSFQWLSRSPGSSIESLVMTLSQDGKLGLGATFPQARFQVNDDFNKLAIGNADNLSDGTSYIGFNTVRNESLNQWKTSNDGMNNGGGLIYNDIFGNICLAPVPSTGTSDQVLSDLDAKSKITFRVGADGTTYAKKIKVELTGWPDYVFKPAYNLKPLSEVKTYINQNHHLPDMPSEKEVADKGIDLGEMNKLITKKVEELTLYLIQKDDVIRNQQIQIERLSQQMQDVLKKLK